MSNAPIVLTFAGVGGSGKSLVSKELKKFYGDSIACAPSFTREGYATARSIGLTVPNEAAALALSAEDAGSFQTFLLENFLAKARNFIKVSRCDPKVKAIVFERSPFDHLAYIRTQVLVGNYHTPTLNKKIESFQKQVAPHVVYFQPPEQAPWYTAASLTDGFRKVDPKKNYELDVELVSQLALFKPAASTYFTTYDLNQRVNAVVKIIEEAHRARAA